MKHLIFSSFSFLFILSGTLLHAQGLYQKTEQILVGNGLNVTLIHCDTSNAQVGLNAFINYGSNSDRAATEGIAEILATAFQNGCESYPKDSLKSAFNVLNTELKVTLSPAYTRLQFTVDKKYTEEAIGLMAAILSAPQLDAAWLQQAQTQIRAANTINNLSTTEVAKRVADGFANPNTETIRSTTLNSINLDGLQEVYAFFYSPVNTHLVLTGNVNGKVLKPLLDSAFASWRFKFPVSPKMAVLPKPEILTPAYAFAPRPTSTYTSLCWVKEAPHFGAKDDLAFQLALGAFRDLCYLETEGNLQASGIRFSTEYDELKNDGSFKICADANPDDAPKAINLFNELLYKFNDRGITEAQLRRQKTALKSRYQNQTPEEIAAFFNPVLYPDLKERKTYLADLEKVELKDVLDAMKSYFGQQQFKCAVVGPKEVFGNTITDFKRYSLSSFDVNR